MAYKTIWGLLSVGLGVAAYWIYIKKTFGAEGIKPHPFSWYLWFMVTLVAYLVQRERGGGAGSWVTALTAAACFFVATLSLLKYSWDFSKGDWFYLLAGAGVVVCYYLVRNPTWSAVLATTADVLGYYSTIRKGWVQPHSDSALAFFLNSVKFLAALPALGSYSVATCLYPTTIFIVNGGVTTMLLERRQQIRNESGRTSGRHANRARKD
jgi:hypothetical protein